MDLPYAEVIGDPIAHSKSPIIHHHWLAGLGIAAQYRATRVRSEELEQFLAERRADPNWRGCNLTIPHKEKALAHLDALDGTAHAVGAVNCIVPRRRGLVGYNSDVDGVASALDRIPIGNAEVAVIGGGGAARAALAYLVRREVKAIKMVLRNPDRGAKLKNLASEGLAVIASFNDAARLLDGARLIINASPLGMTGCPEMPRSLLAAVAAQRNATLFDMVYDPLLTAFLRAGRAERIDGLSMLVGQAARAFELFFDRPPPADTHEVRRLLLGADSSAA